MSRMVHLMLGDETYRVDDAARLNNHFGANEDKVDLVDDVTDCGVLNMKGGVSDL